VPSRSMAIAAHVDSLTRERERPPHRDRELRETRYQSFEKFRTDEDDGEDGRPELPVPFGSSGGESPSKNWTSCTNLAPSSRVVRNEGLIVAEDGDVANGGKSPGAARIASGGAGRTYGASVRPADF
jgi:hypothetical protein